MSEPTQQDRERAKVFADLVSPTKYGPDVCNMARVLLALLAEREAAWPTEVTFGGGMRMGKTAAIKALNEARASGRRAGLLELAEWLETSRGGLDPLPEPRAYYEGQRDVLGNVASRARAMVSEQPRTPSRMDDPDE